MLVWNDRRQSPTHVRMVSVNARRVTDFFKITFVIIFMSVCLKAAV